MIALRRELAWVERGREETAADRRRELREALRAAMRTWVQCAGCGRSMRGIGILCSRCKFKPRTVA